jgi:hypothetical protein
MTGHSVFGVRIILFALSTMFIVLPISYNLHCGVEDEGPPPHKTHGLNGRSSQPKPG